MRVDTLKTVRYSEHLGLHFTLWPDNEADRALLGVMEEAIRQGTAEGQLNPLGGLDLRILRRAPGLAVMPLENDGGSQL